MVYDPYDRGDNPWRSDFGVPRMDMPKSQPSARPGTSRTAALPAKKKSNLAADPDLKGLRWQDGKITREPATTSSTAPAPRKFTGTRDTFVAPEPPPRPPAAPAVTSGILATPPILNNLPPPPPVNPMGGERGPGLPRYGVHPDLQREPPSIAGPAPPPDWLKRLFAGGNGNNPGQTFDPNQPSGSIY